MSCCIVPKVKKSSSIKQLDQLRDYFDFVELEDLEKYRVLTLKNQVKKRDTIIEYEVWLQVKIAYASGMYSSGHEKLLEHVCTQILEWKDKLLYFDKQKKSAQLSLFGDETTEDKPPVSPESGEEKSWSKYWAEEKKYKRKQLEKFSFFELCPLNGHTYGTYQDIDYREHLPKTNKEMIKLVKDAIIRGTTSEKGHGRFDDFWWDDEYKWMTRDGALSDYEIISRVKNLVRLYLVPYHRDRYVSVDLSYTHWIIEAKTDYRFWFDGRKINSHGHHWYEEKDLPSYELYDLEFIEWLREFFNIPYKDMISDEDILKSKVVETLESMLWYKKEEYNLLQKIRTCKNWKHLKADFMSFMKSNDLDSNGGSSGYCIDGFSSSVNRDGKLPELTIKQNIYARELAGRSIDELKRSNYNDNEVIVFSIKGDEIFRLAYELTRKNIDPIQTTLFDF